MSTEINDLVIAPNQFRCDDVVMLVIKDFSKSLKRYTLAVLQCDPFICRVESYWLYCMQSS